MTTEYLTEVRSDNQLVGEFFSSTLSEAVSVTGAQKEDNVTVYLVIRASDGYEILERVLGWTEGVDNTQP